MRLALLACANTGLGRPIGMRQYGLVALLACANTGLGRPIGMRQYGLGVALLACANTGSGRALRARKSLGSVLFRCPDSMCTVFQGAL